MNIDLRHTREFDFKLDARQLLEIHGGEGLAIAARAGRVWLTQLGDRRDIILDAGASFVLDSPRVALVLPFAPAEITIRRISSTWPQRFVHFLLRALTLDKFPRVVFRGDPG